MPYTTPIQSGLAGMLPMNMIIELLFITSFNVDVFGHVHYRFIKIDTFIDVDYKLIRKHG